MWGSPQAGKFGLPVSAKSNGSSSYYDLHNTSFRYSDRLSLPIPPAAEPGREPVGLPVFHSSSLRRLIRSSREPC